MEIEIKKKKKNEHILSHGTVDITEVYELKSRHRP